MNKAQEKEWQVYLNGMVAALKRQDDFIHECIMKPKLPEKLRGLVCRYQTVETK